MTIPRLCVQRRPSPNCVYEDDHPQTVRAAEYQERCGQTEETAPETSASDAQLHDTQVSGIVELAGKSRNVKKVSPLVQYWKIQSAMQAFF